MGSFNLMYPLHNVYACSYNLLCTLQVAKSVDENRSRNVIELLMNARVQAYHFATFSTLITLCACYSEGLLHDNSVHLSNLWVSLKMFVQEKAARTDRERQNNYNMQCFVVQPRTEHKCVGNIMHSADNKFHSAIG